MNAGRTTRRIRRPFSVVLLLAILLDAGRAEPRKAVAVDRILPGEKFLDGQRISAAGLFRRNHLPPAANPPALGSRRREIGDRKRTSVGPDDVLHPRAVGFGHVTLTHWEYRRYQTNSCEIYPVQLKI